MDLKLVIGLVAGILTSSATLPQIIKVFRDKEANSISPLMYFVMLSGNLLWSYYGFMLEEIPIIATNIFSALLDTTMIVLNYKYSKKS